MASTTSLVILDPKSSNEYPNQCVSGFIRNIGNVSGNFLLLQTSGKTITRTLAPLQSYTFTNYYIKSIKNTGTTQLEVELSDSLNTQSSLTIQRLDIGTISGTVNINGNVVISGIADVNITNTTINVAGTVYVNGIVDVSIQNTTINVGGSVSISGITDVSITNSTININGNVNISSSVQLPTDIGNYTQSLQENQTSGTNILTYNPWNFSTSTSYAVSNVGIGDNVNIQQNNARGYLNFWFYVYNYTNSTGSTTVTINLYEHLPTSGTSATLIQQFSFNTGNIASNSGAWVNINPNIFWQYNSLVAQPSSSTTPVTTYPITLSGVPTGSGTYQQLLTISNPSQYGINSTGSNIQFTTASGTQLYAWIENISSSSMNVWVLNNDSNSTINMNVYPTTDNFFSSTGYLGEAPQLSSTYAQYDNGTKVFVNYWNFAGTSLPTGWANYNAATLTVNNGLTWGNGLVGGPSFSSVQNLVWEMYGEVTTFTASQVWLLMFGASVDVASYWSGEGQGSSNGYGFGADNNWIVSSNPTFNTNTFEVFGISFTSSGTTGYMNYQAISGATSTSTPSGTYYIQLWANLTGQVGLTYWIRSRTYVSSMPTYSIGSGSSNVIAVAIPSTANNINSHYWNGSYWNASASGFIGFWQITEASPASLPVMVTNPIQISSGNAQIKSTTSTSQVVYTVPNGKKWKLLSILMGGGGNGRAASATLIKNGTPVIINGVFAFNGGWEELLHINGATITTTTYIGIAGITTPTNEGSGVATQSQQWQDYPILFPGDAVAILNELVNPWSGMWYEEENL